MKKITIKGAMTYEGLRHSFKADEENTDTDLLALSARGVSRVKKDGSMEFLPDLQRCPIPPTTLLVAAGDRWRVRRSSRNYVVSIKLPVFQSRAESEELHRAAWAEAMGEITLDRKAMADAIA